MCTLNGAQFLPAQLDSVLQQSHRDWSLWVSDDGSSDATKTILAAFQAANPIRDIRIFDGPGQGVAANFLSLMCRFDPKADLLVALSDQDDVWLPGKLARGVAAITAASRQGHPVVYATAQLISASDLTRQRPSRPVRAGPSFGNALVQNILSGNSLILNSSALALVQQNLPPTGVPFHDWWIYQLVIGADGTVIYDREPTLIYRRHDANTLGGNLGFAAMRRRAAKVLGREYLSWVKANATALKAVGDTLTPENRALLDRFSSQIGKGGARRARALRELGIGRQSQRGTLVLLLAAFLGRV